MNKSLVKHNKESDIFHYPLNFFNYLILLARKRHQRALPMSPLIRISLELAHRIRKSLF